MVHKGEHGELDAMLDINIAQKEYYEKDLSLDSAGNLATRTWRKARRRLQHLRHDLGVEGFIIDKHRTWLGDLSGQSVMDLGCFSGNILSLEIARNAERYLGVDLSEPAVQELKEKLDAEGILGADAVALDFLSGDLGDQRFDVIYMWGVAHHFRHFETFLTKLNTHLSDNGRIITLDPLETYFPAKLVRGIYRPFQSDAKWEWPFTRQKIHLLEQYFDLKDMQGVMGRAKWAFPISFFSYEMAMKYGRKWVAFDEKNANGKRRQFWSCLTASLYLSKKARAGVN